MPTRAGTVAVLILVALALPATAAEAIAAHLVPIVYEQGVEAAVIEYRHLRSERRSDFDFAESQLNTLGNYLLRDRRYDDAASIFSLNIERFPMSLRARAGLAECYVRLGDMKKARSEYRHALWMIDTRGISDPSLDRNIRVQLLRLESYPVFEALVGVYRVEDGRLLSVSITEPNHGRLPPQLRMVEFPSGRARTLHKKSDLSYYTGPSLGMRAPVEERFKFMRDSDGPASAIRIRSSEGETRAVRIDVRSEEVAFKSDNAELEGTLLLPPDIDGRVPTIILVHGSGNATRDSPGLGELAHFLVVNGYAVLRYDKRGWGNSSVGGNELTLRQLARDAFSAYRYLEKRPDVAPDRIGFAGFSEGAWVVGIVAANPLARPGFVILLSGGGIEPWRQELYRVGAELRAEGYSEEKISHALGFMNRKFEVARTGTGWDTFASEMRLNESEAWYKYVRGWPSLEFARMAWGGVLQYQPERILRRINCPVLALLGDNDVITPPDATALALKAAFDGKRQDLLQVSVFPGGNHMLLEAETGTVRFSDELGAAKRYAGGYFDTLGNWLAGRKRTTEIVETSAP